MKFCSILFLFLLFSVQSYANRCEWIWGQVTRNRLDEDKQRAEYTAYEYSRSASIISIMQRHIGDLSTKHFQIPLGGPTIEQFSEVALRDGLLTEFEISEIKSKAEQYFKDELKLIGLNYAPSSSEAYKRGLMNAQKRVMSDLLQAFSHVKANVIRPNVPLIFTVDKTKIDANIVSEILKLLPKSENIDVRKLYGYAEGIVTDAYLIKIAQKLSGKLNPTFDIREQLNKQLEDLIQFGYFSNIDRRNLERTVDEKLDISAKKFGLKTFNKKFRFPFQIGVEAKTARTKAYRDVFNDLSPIAYDKLDMGMRYISDLRKKANEFQTTEVDYFISHLR